MRIMLRLKSNKEVAQNKENNSKFYTGMHGWIYGKLKNTDFSEVYSKKEFKPFCFSNIFSIKNEKINEDEMYNVIISSPNEMIMIALLSNIDVGEQINLGEYSFELISYKPLARKEIQNFSKLNNETLLNICLPEDKKGKLAKKAITLERDPENFKKQLAKNLTRKYNQYYEKNIEEGFNLWKNVKITQIENSEKVVRLNLIKESDNFFDVIGARYSFEIGEIDETQRAIFQLCYDLGFGERNSFGFGFMNIKKDKKESNDFDEKGEITKSKKGELE